MIPKSFSATSLQTAEGCLSRYHAEVILRTAGPQGDAANVGIVCHDTLEKFVRGVFQVGNLEWEWKVIEELYNEAFDTIIGSDRSVPAYADGYALIRKWFYDESQLENLRAVQILSLEVKNNFEIPAGVDDGTGVIRERKFPVNYIMDRVERISPGEYRVVDYKTNWVPLNHEQLRFKIQARLYALALQIIYKDAERIWVEFHFLRHENIGVVFTKEDNADTWRMLKRAVQRIVNTSDADAAKSETINDECSWCVKKATCKALASNIAGGGVHGLTAGEAAVRYAQVRDHAKALKFLEEELQDYLMQQLMAAKTINLDTDEATVKLKTTSRREVDQHAVAQILGPEVMAQIGTVTLGSLDELKKTGQLTADQIQKIDMVTKRKPGKAGIAVTVKK